MHAPEIVEVKSPIEMMEEKSHRQAERINALIRWMW